MNKLTQSTKDGTTPFHDKTCTCYRCRKESMTLYSKLEKHLPKEKDKDTWTGYFSYLDGWNACLKDIKHKLGVTDEV